MRGNHSRNAGYAPPVRSIPAYAGEPVATLPEQRPQRVYPRVCGGTDWKGDCVLAAAGLSPRMRGNRWYRLVAENRKRSIPAYAGEPQSGGTGQPSRWVYPRVCGGTRPVARLRGGNDGLSPRMRGNRRVRRR